MASLSPSLPFNFSPSQTPFPFSFPFSVVPPAHTNTHVSVWNCHHSLNHQQHCKCIAKLCMVDIICFKAPQPFCTCRRPSIPNLHSPSRQFCPSRQASLPQCQTHEIFTIYSFFLYEKLSKLVKDVNLGAVEFLSKPLSEDKLRNIWQHVVHKAFNAGASVQSESLKPVKESVVSVLQLQTDNGHHESRMAIDIDEVSRFTDNDHEKSPRSDKFPVPSTRQLNQGARLLDDGDCQEQTNCSTEKESGENLDAESTPQ